MSIFAYQSLKGLQLTERVVLDLMARLEILSFEVGDDIAQQKGAGLYLICDGLAMGCLSNGWGAPSAIDMYGPNTWVGGAGVFGAEDVATRYVCLAPSRVIYVPLAPGMGYLESERAFNGFVGKLLRWRNSHQMAMISATKAAQPGVRIALLLAILAQGILCSHSHLPVAWQANGPLVPSNQSVIADYVGLSRSVVSRHLQELVGAGLMRLNYGSIEFLNTPAWQALYQAHVRNTLTSHRTLGDLFGFLREPVAA
jgi:CRP-like cAMP-binding protein